MNEPLRVLLTNMVGQIQSLSRSTGKCEPVFLTQQLQAACDSKEPTPNLPSDDKRCFGSDKIARCRFRVGHIGKCYFDSLCFVPDCETLCAPGKIYCHEHYDELFNKPVPKPPPPPENEGMDKSTTVELPREWGGTMPTAEEFSRVLKEGYAAMAKPASTTCPACGKASVEHYCGNCGVHLGKKTPCDAAFDELFSTPEFHHYSKDQLWDKAWNACERNHHGIKP